MRNLLGLLSGLGLCGCIMSNPEFNSDTSESGEHAESVEPEQGSAPSSDEAEEDAGSRDGGEDEKGDPESGNENPDDSESESNESAQEESGDEGHEETDTSSADSDESEAIPDPKRAKAATEVPDPRAIPLKGKAAVRMNQAKALAPKVRAKPEILNPTPSAMTWMTA